jgi:branched-chain amino acid aminotransferase
MRNLNDENIKNIIKDFTIEGPIPFGKLMMPIMIESHFNDGKWSEMEIVPYGPLQIDPAAKVLHYAQEIFEGMKAYKNEKDEVFLFRPEENAKRFNDSAKRMAMPEFPIDKFVESNKVFSDLLREHIPNRPGSSLYLRPFMIATEPALGVRASSTYSYYLIGCIAESYFKRPNVKVKVEDEYIRAAPGGIGFAKTGGNYGASLLAFKNTEKEDCEQTLWLDAIEKKYIEELSGMNFYAVIGDDLVTPKITDTILSGITRKSILTLARRFGLNPVEKKLSIVELISEIESGRCTEAFACGTASVLTPIQSFKYKDKTYKVKFENGNKSQEIRKYLLELQRGNEEDLNQWVVKV